MTRPSSGTMRRRGTGWSSRSTCPCRSGAAGREWHAAPAASTRLQHRTRLARHGSIHAEDGLEQQQGLSWSPWRLWPRPPCAGTPIRPSTPASTGRSTIRPSQATRCVRALLAAGVHGPCQPCHRRLCPPLPTSPPPLAPLRCGAELDPRPAAQGVRASVHGAGGEVPGLRDAHVQAADARHRAPQRPRRCATVIIVVCRRGKAKAAAVHRQTPSQRRGPGTHALLP